MSGDGVVSIGATFDKTNVDAGLGETQEMVKASMDAISATITEANAKSKAAWKGLSDEVKQSAASMNAEALKVAESSKAVAAAQADVRRAWTLSKDASIPLEQSMGTLAAAQVRLTEAQAAAAAAAKEQATAVAAAAEEEALSQNVVVAAFQRMSISVRESLTAVQEKMVQTAETSGLEAEGISAGFGGLSKLLGAGLVVGFAANYIDGLAKINVELEHLATKTGISITSLAGLQQILKEAGGDFEAVATGLVRMESNVEKLSEGKAAPVQLADAFTNLGLKLDDVRKADPGDLLQMIASGMAKTADANIRANSAIAIFGRGGQALIPVLREQGEQLSENMKKEGDLTGITDKTAEAARRWTQDVARLSAQFRNVMMPVMEHAEDVIRFVAAGFEAAAAVIVSAFEGIATAIVSMFAPLYRYGILMKDVFTGNWGALQADAKATTSAFVDTWKAGFAEIKANWAEVHRTFAERSELPPMPKGTDSEGGDYEPPAKKGRRNAAFEADRQQLDEIKLDHEVTLEEEIKFWQQKLSIAKKGSDEYKSIVATLAPLEQKEDRKPKVAAPAPPETQSQDMSSDSAAFIATLQDQVKTTQNATREQLQAYRDLAEEKIRLAHEDYEDVEKNSQFEVQMGRMTAMERLAVLRQAAVQEQQIRQAESKFIAMLDSNEQKKYEADLKKEEQDTRQFTRQITQLNQQAALQTEKVWQQAYQRMTAQINQDVAKWIVTGQSFEKSMAKAMAGITENFIANMLKMMEQEIMAAITHKSLMSQQIIADAKTAAANAYNWASSWGGPPAGVIAAAAAFAGVMAFDSFAAGGVVQGGGGMAVPILAHAGERVLSPAQTSNFEKMVNQSSSSSATHNTTHLTQNLNGYDRAGMKAALRDHADDILSIVQGGYRSGALSA